MIDQVAFISKISINREDLLRHLFGDHYIRYEKKRKKKDVEPILLKDLNIGISTFLGMRISNSKILGCVAYTIFLYSELKMREPMKS